MRRSPLPLWWGNTGGTIATGKQSRTLYGCNQIRCSLPTAILQTNDGHTTQVWVLQSIWNTFLFAILYCEYVQYFQKHWLCCTILMLYTILTTSICNTFKSIAQFHDSNGALVRVTYGCISDCIILTCMVYVHSKVFSKAGPPSEGMHGQVWVSLPLRPRTSLVNTYQSLWCGSNICEQVLPLRQANVHQNKAVITHEILR